MFSSGKLVSRPDLTTIYYASYSQMWSSDISVLLQKQHTPAFSLCSLDFYSFPNAPYLGKLFIILSVRS